MKPTLAVLALAAPLALGGCIAKTALGVVTAPVKAASGAVDLATTSQSEADEKRGRQMREAEERLGKLQRRYDGQMKECREGDQAACYAARTTYAEMQELRTQLPPPMPES